MGNKVQTERELALKHEDFAAFLFQSVGEIGECETQFGCNLLHFVGVKHDCVGLCVIEMELGIGNWGLEMRENKGCRRESLEGINLVSNFFHHHNN